MKSNTPNGALFDRPVLRSMLQEACAFEPADLGSAPARLLHVKCADHHGQRRGSASVSIKRLDASHGRRGGRSPGEQNPTCITLIASEKDATVGAITMGFDSNAGLRIDSLFAEETMRLRRAGHRLCEFTKLQVDSVIRSKSALASLFHVAYIYSHRVMGFDSLLIEVNPRHVLYYERVLCFCPVGSQRLDHRINAATVLMRLDFSHVRAQIEKFGGRPDCSPLERSLYPYFFSVTEEAGIVGRMMQDESPVPMGAAVCRSLPLGLH